MSLRNNGFPARAVTHYWVTMGDEAVAKYPGLSARENGIWYVRKRVPVDLVGLEKRASLRVSLDTADLRTAKKRYPFKLAEIEAHFDALRNRLQTMGATETVLAAGKIERLRERDIDAIVSDWWQRREAARRPEINDADELAEVVIEIERDAQYVLAGAESEVVYSVADALLVHAGFPARSHRVGAIATQVRYPTIDRSLSGYRYLCDLVARGLSTEAALAKDYLLSRKDAPHDPVFNPIQSDTRSASSANDRRLSDLFSSYSSERVATRGEGDTAKRYGFVFRIMEEVLGREKPVASLTRADCVEVLTFLKRLPPNATKRFPTLSLTEIADKADAQALPRLAPNSVATYMQSLAAALRWAKKAEWNVNVDTSDLIVSRAAMVKRRGFRSEELERLFASLAPFRHAEPAKFWVPALALFTGARAGEICQLRTEDVVNVEGVSCLNLSLFDAEGRRVEDKRLKTKASERYVPLHPLLIEAGFVVFAREGREGDRLFPALEQGPDGRYSHNFSKWFGRHKKRAGFDEPALVFHSFRHGFRDACRRAEINEETAQALGGWASESQAARYGNRSMIPVLDRAIRKLDFGGFNLPSDA
jgi:integrase